MANPIFIYILSFLLVLIVYCLGWSALYPTLSVATIAFLIITFLISGYIGKRVNDKKIIKFNKVHYNIEVLYGTVAILVGYIMEFIYVGSIPLLGRGNNYMEFTGIPTFHVILFTFTIFFEVYLFHVLLSSKNYRVLIFMGINFVPSILLMSRGMMMNIFIGCFFVLAAKIGNDFKFYKKHILKFIGVFLLVLFMFGVSGNYRNNSINKVSNKFSSNYIMDVGEATDGFRNSFIPKEFFWGYIYISSPLANFQYNVDHLSTNVSLYNIKSFVSNEIVMDFISKRIFKDTYNTQKPIKLISDNLTVATFYAGAYYYLGWIGVVIIFAFLILMSYVYLLILSENNPFKVTGIAMLCNVVALCTFSNMITFSGMTFQLLYPVFWEVYTRLKRWYKYKKREAIKL